MKNIDFYDDRSSAAALLSSDVHFPDADCTCFAGPVYDFQRRAFKNGTLHVYRYCKCCGARARAPVKRETVSLSKWRELLIESGREVVPL